MLKITQQVVDSLNDKQFPQKKNKQTNKKNCLLNSFVKKGILSYS